MSTANTQSPRFEDLRIVTSAKISESNNEDDNANTETPGSGFFMTPSTITGRTADVTGFLVTAENELGKFEWSDPDGFLSLGQLSDVTLTSPATNNLLSFNGTEWVNTNDITVTSVTYTKGTETQQTDITTAVTLNTASGVITTQAANAAAQGTNTFTVNNSTVLATSIVMVSILTYAGTAGLPMVFVDNLTAGSFDVVITNVDESTGGAALDGAFTIGFVVL